MCELARRASGADHLILGAFRSRITAPSRRARDLRPEANGPRRVGRIRSALINLYQQRNRSRSRRIRVIGLNRLTSNRPALNIVRSVCFSHVDIFPSSPRPAAILRIFEGSDLNISEARVVRCSPHFNGTIALISEKNERKEHTERSFVDR